MQIISKGRCLDLGVPRIMGILNVTPDSFSDGGLHNTPEKALDHAARMLSEGADIIDIGGESTRPRSRAPELQEELDRVIPAVEAVVSRLDTLISVDTSRPEVISAAVNAGAHIWNDIRALRLPGACSCAARLGIPVILMHMQGTPRTMQQAPHYQDVVREVACFLLKRAEAAMQVGVRREQLILDPGFGFGKSVQDNFKLLSHLDELCDLGFPVLAGLSRKSMLGAVCGLKLPGQRTTASVAAHLISVMKGARIVRVHDVRATWEALKVFRALDIKETVTPAATAGTHSYACAAGDTPAEAAIPESPDTAAQKAAEAPQGVSTAAASEK